MVSRTQKQAAKEIMEATGMPYMAALRSLKKPTPVFEPRWDQYKYQGQPFTVGGGGPKPHAVLIDNGTSIVEAAQLAHSRHLARVIFNQGDSAKTLDEGLKALKAPAEAPPFIDRAVHVFVENINDLLEGDARDHLTTLLEAGPSANISIIAGSSNSDILVDALGAKVVDRLIQLFTMRHGVAYSPNTPMDYAYSGLSGNLRVKLQELFTPDEHQLYADTTGNLKEFGQDGLNNMQTITIADNFYDHVLTACAETGAKLWEISIYAHDDYHPTHTLTEHRLTDLWWEVQRIKELVEYHQRQPEAEIPPCSVEHDILNPHQEHALEELVYQVLAEEYKSEETKFLATYLDEDLIPLECAALLARPYIDQYPGWNQQAYELVTYQWNKNQNMPLHPQDLTGEKLVQQYTPQGARGAEARSYYQNLYQQFLAGEAALRRINEHELATVQAMSVAISTAEEEKTQPVKDRFYFFVPADTRSQKTDQEIWNFAKGAHHDFFDERNEWTQHFIAAGQKYLTPKKSIEESLELMCKFDKHHTFIHLTPDNLFSWQAKYRVIFFVDQFMKPYLKYDALSQMWEYDSYMYLRSLETNRAEHREYVNRVIVDVLGMEDGARLPELFARHMPELADEIAAVMMRPKLLETVEGKEHYDALTMSYRRTLGFVDLKDGNVEHFVPGAEEEKEEDSPTLAQSSAVTLRPFVSNPLTGFDLDKKLIVYPSGELARLREEGLDEVFEDEIDEYFTSEANFYERICDEWGLSGTEPQDLSIYAYDAENPQGTLAEYPVVDLWPEIARVKELMDYYFALEADSPEIERHAYLSSAMDELDQMKRTKRIIEVLEDAYGTDKANFLESMVGGDVFTLEFLALLARPFISKYKGWGQKEYAEATKLWDESMKLPLHPHDPSETTALSPTPSKDQR